MHRDIELNRIDDMTIVIEPNRKISVGSHPYSTMRVKAFCVHRKRLRSLSLAHEKREQKQKCCVYNFVQCILTHRTLRLSASELHSPSSDLCFNFFFSLSEWMRSAPVFDVPQTLV